MESLSIGTMAIGLIWLLLSLLWFALRLNKKKGIKKPLISLLIAFILISHGTFVLNAYSPKIKTIDKIKTVDDLANITVYITRTGKKYHFEPCRYLSKSKRPISLKVAIQWGYTPCSICRPPYIEIEKLEIERPEPIEHADILTVYITRTGKKYHRENCSYLRRSKNPISLRNAWLRGYRPCSRCNPPRIIIKKDDKNLAK